MSDYDTPYDLAADEYANGEYEEDDTPREITVTRYVCPHCSRGHSKKPAAKAHIARCQKNPGNRGCRSCYFHIPPGGSRGGCVPGQDCDCNVVYEDCAAEIDLSGGLATGCPKWKSRHQGLI